MFILPPHQDKKAKDGDCYIGMVMFYPNFPNAREYVETDLIVNLHGGKEYCVSLNVVHSTNCNYTISNFHLGFRKDSTFQNDNKILIVDTFYRFETNVLKDSVNWTKLELKFTATGNERYLSIGNFDSTQNVVYEDYNAITNPPYLQDYSYYFFDKITLEECPPPLENHLTVYPNPSDGHAIFIDQYADTTSEVILYNSIGQVMGYKQLPAGEYKGEAFSNLAAGVYILRMQTATGYREEEKVIVTK